MAQQKQITIVAAVIRNEQGNILLAKRHQPQTPEIDGIWEFAGGGVEFGEDPLDAVKREVKEELGVEVEVVRLLPKIISDIQHFNDGTDLQVLVITYECKIISGTPQAKLDEEIAEVKFVPMEEAKTYKAFENIKQTLDLLTASN